MTMIKPHGADAPIPLLVSDEIERARLLAEAGNLPVLTLNSAAAANAITLGGGYFTPLTGYTNVADAMSIATDMRAADGLY
jgi:sulfate adenylyltransferase